MSGDGRLMRVARGLKAVLMILLFGALLAGVLWLGYTLYRTRIEAAYYKEGVKTSIARYQSVLDHYNLVAKRFMKLRDNYNRVLSRTAITELKVQGKKCFVVLRNSEGVIAEVETPVDLSKEVFVDYVVFDNKLFIRRVFDSSTAPDSAHDLFADGAIRSALPGGAVNWDVKRFKFGKSIYRRLDEGVWMITVTGGGALAIERKEKVPHLGFIDPVKGVPLQRFAREDFVTRQKEMDRQIERYRKQLSFVDVIRHVISQPKQVSAQPR